MTYDFKDFDLSDYLENKLDETRLATIAWFDSLNPSWRKMLGVCESPIEQILYLYLLTDKPKDMEIELQRHVFVGGGRRRVDFLICYQNKRLFIVEADGRQHRRSVRYDKLSDELLLQAGYETLRCTGRRIVKEPDKCAQEVIQKFEEKKGVVFARERGA